MTRPKRGRGGNKSRGGWHGGGRGGNGGGQRPVVDDRVSFDKVQKQNEKMERFYNTLNIVPEGEERDKFWAALRRELPNSFRFTGSKGHALGVRDNLVERFFPVISQIQHEGKPVALPVVMPWYPEGLAYSMTTPKNVVRKYEPFKEFQKFLVSETGVGNISRQEAVSMIPPLVMDLQPHHTCLDLCAAPGSKTAQLIEMIHAGEETRIAESIRNVKNASVESSEQETGDYGRSEGLLIANDVNYKRAQMLTHQVKRLNSPNLIVTNHDATMYPSIALPSELGPGKQNRYLKFDRILADVPCSGDGTCRKNPGIWKDWSPQNAMGLYITQVRILTRALQMLKVGGRVVYSTCSMNPVEDEAVVSSAIERCGGVDKVELIDCSDKLPGLVRNSGLQDWSIMSRSGQIYESWPEAAQFEPDDSKVVPGMFAPEPAERIPLQHCMRVYPHQQDTGGFFIAVLEKKSEIHAKPEHECKCFSKEWTFQQPTAQGEKTVFSELLDEIDNEPVDANGHIHKEIGDGSAMTEPSAAERQNTQVPDTVSVKRKAEDEIDQGALSPKKTKVEDSSVDVVNGGQAVGVAGAPASNAVQNGALGTMPKRRRDQEAQAESFKYLPSDHPALQSIYQFYELHPSFPRDRFLVRNPAGDPVKGIYYSSQLAKDILIANESRKMKFVHGGVRMLQKQDVQGQDTCPWRIQTEGLPIIEGWVGEARVVRLNKRSTLRKLLVEMFLRVGELDAKGTGWQALGEIGPQVRNLSMGCCVLRVETSDDPDGFREALTLPLWRSLHSVNLMLPKEDRKAMLLRLFNEDIELINHTELNKKQNAAAGNVSSVNGDGDGSLSEAAAVKDEEGAPSNIDDNNDMEVEDIDGAAQAMEADALARRDVLEAEKLEEMEDENNKITAAMPERDHEGDEYNTTV